MSLITPNLPQIVAFLKTAEEKDRKAAGTLTDVETVASLATRISLVTDFASAEWNDDLLPQIADLFQQSNLATLSKYSSRPWGLPSPLIDKTLRVLSKASDAEKEVTWDGFFSLFSQTQDKRVQFELTLSVLPSIRETLPHHIDKLSFDENKRFALARKGASLEHEVVSQHIQQYRLSDEKRRFLVARVALRNGSCLSTTAKYIDRYEIKNEDLRLQLAQVSVEQWGNHTAEYFTNFQLSKEADRAALVIPMLRDRMQVSTTLSHWYNFDIQDPEHLFELLKHFDDHYFDKVLAFSSKMKEEQRLFLIKKQLRTHAWYYQSKVDPQLISNEELRVKLLCSEKHENLPSLKIQDSQILLSLAETAAKRFRYFSEFAKSVRVYKIKNEADRIRLAILNLECSRYSLEFLEHVANFEIQNPVPVIARYFIANPESLSSKGPPELVQKIGPELSALKAKQIDEAFLSSRSPAFSAQYRALRRSPAPDRIIQMIIGIEILRFYNNLSDEEVAALESLALDLRHLSSKQHTYFTHRIFQRFFERPLFDRWFRSRPLSTGRYTLVLSASFAIVGAEGFSAHPSFSNRKQVAPLFSFLRRIDSHFPQRASLASHLFYPGEDPSQRLPLLASLLPLEMVSCVSSLLSIPLLEGLRRAAFADELDLPPLVTDTVFKQWKKPHQISWYLFKINKTSPEMRSSLKRLYREWLIASTTGREKEAQRQSFYYRKLVALGVPEKTLEAWETGGKETRVSFERKPLEQQMVEFFRRHSVKEFFEKFPFFGLCFKEPAKEPIEELLAKNLQKLEKEFPSPKNDLERAFFHLCQKATLEDINKVRGMIANLSFTPTRFLKRDLDDLYFSLVKEKRKPKKTYQLLDSIHPEDFFLLKGETFCSLKKMPIKFSLRLNHWTNRVLVLKDPESNQVLAARHLKFVWNKTNKCPTLCLRKPRFYSTKNESLKAFADAQFKNYALELGKQLGLPVLQSDSVPEKDKQKIVLSFSNKTTSDAAPL
ncbi:MAG: hypothetical protein KGJ02_01940 [Verrucomicrobiota bacterium]|nr:hypothetical protein [Verrucomicrobiota bacterium]